jgi:response regulator RpfG family c-di-GMP phosphodiesterase
MKKELDQSRFFCEPVRSKTGSCYGTSAGNADATLRALVVDDDSYAPGNPESPSRYKMQLRSPDEIGFDVEMALSPRSYHVHQCEPPDLLLLDTITSMSGLDLLEQINVQNGNGNDLITAYATWKPP